MLFFESPHLEFGSAQSYLAADIWRKRQKIDLLKTLVGATAVVNPEKSQEVLQELLEEIDPILRSESKRTLENMQEQLQKETSRVYKVSPVNPKKFRANKLTRKKGKPKRA